MNYLTVRKFFNNIDGMAVMCAAINPKYPKNCWNLVVFALVRYADFDLGDDFVSCSRPTKPPTLPRRMATRAGHQQSKIE
ncbi:MAG: hypothetical protein IH978_06850 [Nitrospinae bacterium]|nr:hypothetical protein [Nitrospinota bacterium]